MVEEASDNESEEKIFLSGGESFLRPLQLSMAYKSNRKVNERRHLTIKLKKTDPLIKFNMKGFALFDFENRFAETLRG